MRRALREASSGGSGGGPGQGGSNEHHPALDTLFRTPQKAIHRNPAAVKGHACGRPGVPPYFAAINFFNSATCCARAY